MQGYAEGVRQLDLNTSMPFQCICVAKRLWFGESIHCVCVWWQQWGIQRLWDAANESTINKGGSVNAEGLLQIWGVNSSEQQKKFANQRKKNVKGNL